MPDNIAPGPTIIYLMRDHALAVDSALETDAFGPVPVRESHVAEFLSNHPDSEFRDEVVAYLKANRNHIGARLSVALDTALSTGIG